MGMDGGSTTCDQGGDTETSLSDHRTRPASSLEAGLGRLTRLSASGLQEHSNAEWFPSRSAAGDWLAGWKWVGENSQCQSLGPVRLFVTPWTVAHQAPLSMGFSSKKTEVGCHSLLQGIILT